MSEDYGADIITIVDEDGEEIVLEVLDTLDYNGKSYGAFLPTDIEEDDPDYGMIILHIGEENGEEYFEDVEDENELNEVYEKFMALLFDDDEEEEEK